MVNVGRVVQQSAPYYIQQVAGNAEEYYSARGEAQGQWMGGGSAALGLSRTVNADAFISILNGRKPGAEATLAPSFPRRKVLGIDTVFRAPKSVSLMFGIGNGEIRAEVLAAHDAAVFAGMDYLERHAAVGREGKGGAKKVRGDGLISAAWPHRTSRAGDPLVHTHVVSANMIHTENDRWVTLDSKRIYRHAKAAGVLYQSELRHQLKERLNVDFEPVKNGLSDVVGVERKIIDTFSKRSNQIKTELEETENAGPKAAQLAALKSRAAKGAAESDNLFESWAEEAAELGFTSESVAALCVSTLEVRAAAERDYESIAAHLVSPRGLTAKRSTFDRRDVISAFAEQFPPTTSAAKIESAADRWIGEFSLVVRDQFSCEDLDGAIRHQGSGEAALTTLDMVEVELGMVSSATARVNTQVAMLSDEFLHLVTACESFQSLNDGQTEMVDHSSPLDRNHSSTIPTKNLWARVISEPECLSES